MIGIAYCGKCHSDEVGSRRIGNTEKVEIFCLSCGHRAKVNQFEVRWYFGEHEAKVVNHSRPDNGPFYHTEEREDIHEERLPGEKPRPPVKFRMMNMEGVLADDPQRAFFVSHGDICKEDVEALEAVLARPDAREEDVQQVLTARPPLLVQHLRGGHGRYVIPKPQFGGKYEPDFLIGERASFGLEWTLVELEAPKRAMFSKSGRPSKWLTHAMHQVEDWRSWLAYNKATAERETARGGLGLGEIDVRTLGLILMGRRTDIDSLTNERRRGLQTAHNMQIRTYDWLLDVCRGQAWMW